MGRPHGCNCRCVHTFEPRAVRYNVRTDTIGLASVRQRLFQEPDTLNLFVRDVCADGSGNVFATDGAGSLGQMLTEYNLRKWDSTGRLQWDFSRPGHTKSQLREGLAVRAMGDSVYVLTPSHSTDGARLLRIDAAAGEELAATAGVSGNPDKPLVVGHDGTLWAKTGLSVTRYDPDALGETKVVDVGGCIRFDVDSGGNIYCLKANPNGGSAARIVARYRSTGAVDWEKPALNFAYEIAVDPSGGAIYFAQGVPASQATFVARYDGDGDEVWAVEGDASYGSTGSNAGHRFIAWHSDGIVVWGNQANSGRIQVFRPSDGGSLGILSYDVPEDTAAVVGGSVAGGRIYSGGFVVNRE